MRVRLLLLCLLSLSLPCIAQRTNYTYYTLPPSGPTVSGDFNRDGWPDLAVVDEFGDGALYIYSGTGSGNFVQTQVFRDSAAFVNVWTVDINGDGYLDLVVVSNSNPSRFFTEMATATSHLVLRRCRMFGSLLT